MHSIFRRLLGARARSIRALARVAIAAALLAPAIGRAAPEPAAPLDTVERTLEGRVVGVLDGDTLTLLVDREEVRVRLAQIDAPERDQPYGQKAKAALAALAFGKPARVEVVDVDSYGRSVGEVFVAGVDVNRELVRGGHAWAYTRYTHSTAIIELEDQARAAKAGLWALPESQREAPWIWRHARQRARARAGPLVCGTRHRCSELADCAEARFYLERCGVLALDGDRDGIPCESLCGRARE
ncbi:MAG TPA: thermonuclease family protein [Myxococcota bacterium]|nr:thermonuclease family protein [Myxococcota bacterium]